VRLGKVFGFPTAYADTKLCICLDEQGVGIKLPEQSAMKLLEMDRNAVPFQPIGRPKMRESIQINLSRCEGYRKYMPVFEQSILYLLAQQGKGES